jgi:hypothetical protein
MERQIQRYDIDAFDTLVESPTGFLVRYEDVAPYIKEAGQPAHNSRVMPCPAYVPCASCGMFKDERCDQDHSCLISRERT